MFKQMKVALWSVSYTHLDVYKRQSMKRSTVVAPPSPLWMMRISCMLSHLLGEPKLTLICHYIDTVMTL